eukprot:CAMPEP_0197916504 /NCGR_PEP_ID=MMETSP1439-20131203/82102_1 /TAXON_ID=66791 /ORGANISM="Gonyaulax spinifera, Strain CCMP409" /LENGTH=438 /DNA_ID=CAMNT_0043538531 /DNA_START=44 /DNA_END=1357 /DNA_ORIENTATION=-
MAGDADGRGVLPPAVRQKVPSQPITEKVVATTRKRFPKHLVDIYDIKSLLGQGAFSTVWRCVHRATGTTRAVKKIDTSELSPREIAHEIALMRLLRNPNVVRCYDVFLEAQYVNIVIDIFTGGDLIDGLNAHRKSCGRVPDAQLAHLSRQMVAAVAHIHSLKIVHRDIKGENFLCDRPDIGDPECRIALADFGTAKRIEPGELLTAHVGTPPFWSPEMWAGRYDFLVDVWAVGVTAYILLSGSLPFDGEVDIRKPVMAGKLPFTPPQCASEKCVDFLGRCLIKDPKGRPSAAELQRHPWMLTPPHRREVKGADKVRESKKGNSSIEQFFTGLGVMVAGCCDGLGLILGALAGSGGGAPAGRVDQETAEPLDKDEIEKQVTEMSRNISKHASKREDDAAGACEQGRAQAPPRRIPWRKSTIRSARFSASVHELSRLDAR